MPLRAVLNEVDFASLERDVLERWERERTFEQSVRRRAGCPPYVFYDGPPFATGLSHYGHILTSYVKALDVVRPVIEAPVLGIRAVRQQGRRV